jgi:hypothetical protein
MSELKSIGNAVLILSLLMAGFGVYIYYFSYGQNIPADGQLPMMALGGLVLVLFFSGATMIYLSKRIDPVAEVEAAFEEQKAEARAMMPEAKPEPLPEVKSRPYNNKEIKIVHSQAELIKAMEEYPTYDLFVDESTNQLFERQKLIPMPELTLEEELEQGKKAYIESMKREAAKGDEKVSPLASHTGTSFEPVKASPEKPSFLQNLFGLPREKSLEKEVRKPAPPPKEKVKFQLFGKKKPTGLKAILEGEEEKMKLEGTSRFNRGD